MADATRHLLIVTGDADGTCDPETGVCAMPEPDVAATEVEPVDEVISESS